MVIEQAAPALVAAVPGVTLGDSRWWQRSRELCSETALVAAVRGVTLGDGAGQIRRGDRAPPPGSLPFLLIRAQKHDWDRPATDDIGRHHRQSAQGSLHGTECDS